METLPFSPLIVKINLDLKYGIPFSYSKYGLSFVAKKDVESRYIKIEITEGDIKNIKAVDSFLVDDPEYDLFNNKKAALNDLNPVDDDNQIEMLLFRLQYQLKKTKQNCKEMNDYSTVLINLKLQRMRAKMIKQIPPVLPSKDHERILFLLADFISLLTTQNMLTQYNSIKIKNFSKRFLIQNVNKNQKSLSFTVAFEFNNKERHYFTTIDYKIIVPYLTLANLKFGDHLLEEINCILPHTPGKRKVIKLKAYWVRKLNSKMIQVFKLFVEKRIGISINNASKDNMVFSVLDKPENQKLHPSTTLKIFFDFNVYFDLPSPFIFSTECNHTGNKIQKECKTNSILPILQSLFYSPNQTKEKTSKIPKATSNIEIPLEHQNCKATSKPIPLYFIDHSWSKKSIEDEEDVEDFVFVNHEPFHLKTNTETKLKEEAKVEQYSEMNTTNMGAQTSIKKCLESLNSIKFKGTKNYTKPSLSIFPQSTVTDGSQKPQTQIFNFGILPKELSKSSTYTTYKVVPPSFNWPINENLTTVNYYSETESKPFAFVSTAATVSTTSNTFFNEQTKEISPNIKKVSIKCRKLESTEWNKTNNSKYMNSSNTVDAQFKNEDKEKPAKNISLFEKDHDEGKEESSFLILKVYGSKKYSQEKMNNFNPKFQNEEFQYEQKNKTYEMMKNDSSLEESDSEISDSISLLSDSDP